MRGLAPRLSLGSPAVLGLYVVDLALFLAGSTKLLDGLLLALATRLALALAATRLALALATRLALALALRQLLLLSLSHTVAIVLASVLAIALVFLLQALATRLTLALATRLTLALATRLLLGLSLGSPAVLGLYVVDLALFLAGSTKLLNSLLALATTRLTLALATRLALALTARFLLALAARFLLVATPGLFIQDLAFRYASCSKFLQGLLLGLAAGLTLALAAGLTPRGLTLFRIVATGLAQVPFVPSVFSALAAAPGLWIQDHALFGASCSKFLQGLLTALTAARWFSTLSSVLCHFILYPTYILEMKKVNKKQEKSENGCTLPNMSGDASAARI